MSCLSGHIFTYNAQCLWRAYSRYRKTYHIWYPYHQECQATGQIDSLHKCLRMNILPIAVCIQDTYDMFEMDGDMDKKKKKKMKKKEKLEGMKKEMDIVSKKK